jgi:MFS family permease
VLHARTFVSLQKHRNYRLFFIGQIVSLSGTWMQDTALPWLVIQRTHSALAVGLLLFCRYLPFTLFGLVAGLLADRFDNRRFLIASQGVSMVVAIALAVVTLLGNAPLGVIFMLAFLGGTAVVFDAPNRHALTFQLVGREELSNAVALNTSLFNVAMVVGPALGGVVIATAGVGTCFGLNAASFLAVLAALSLMRPGELYRLDRGSGVPRGLGAIRDGITYVWREPRLRLIIGLVAVFGPIGFNFRVVLPVLTSKTLHMGAEAFGVLWTCFGTGALIGALCAAGSHFARPKLLLGGLLGFSGAMTLLAPFRDFVTACALLFIVGACFSLWTVSSQSMVQLASPDRLRGRVVSLYLFVWNGLTPAGSLLIGWLASVGGTPLAFGFAGVIGLVLTGFLSRRLWIVEDTEIRITGESAEAPA